MAAKHLVVGVAGALITLLAVAGLMEIDARAGPYEKPLQPAELTLAVEGQYQAAGPKGSTGPGGVCIPDTPGGECAPARLAVDLRLAGLAPMAPEAHYVAFLTGPGLSPIVLGTLSHEDDRHTLDAQDDRDAREYETLVVALHKDAAAATPGALRVYAADVADHGQDAPYDLPAAATVTLLEATGSVRATEIGGFSISTTAIGDIALDAPLAEWELHAWFTPHTATNEAVHLGTWEFTDDARHAVLDARVERLRLEDQRAFVTTLTPAGVDGDAADGIDGLAVFTAPMAD